MNSKGIENNKGNDIFNIRNSKVSDSETGSGSSQVIKSDNVMSYILVSTDS